MLGYMTRLLRNRKGFTLIELMIVIVILGILAGGAMMLLNESGTTGKANLGRIKGDLRTLQSAALLHRLDTNNWPASIGELATDGYVQRIPTSPFSTHEYAWDATNHVVVLSETGGTAGLLDTGEDVYAFTTPESFTASAANL